MVGAGVGDGVGATVGFGVGLALDELHAVGSGEQCLVEGGRDRDGELELGALGAQEASGGEERRPEPANLLAPRAGQAAKRELRRLLCPALR